MAPLFGSIPAPPAAQSAIPKGVGTALFLHRIRKSMKPAKGGSTHPYGHNVVHTPVYVKPHAAIVHSPKIGTTQSTHLPMY